MVHISGLPSWRSSCCVKFLGAHFPGSRQTEARSPTGLGFGLLLEEHALGLTERRAAWVVKWDYETAAARVVHIRASEEALGRTVFATSALELLRPFLAARHQVRGTR